MAVVFAVIKWRHYLLGNKVYIKTDHQSLRYLLDQRITTTNEQKWITRLMGLDYEISYKKGKENVAADGLSRQMAGNQIQCFGMGDDEQSGGSKDKGVSSVLLSWVQEIALSWQADQGLVDTIIKLQVEPNSMAGYSFQNGRLEFQGKLVVGPIPELRKKFLQEFHQSAIGGHSGIKGTLERISLFVWWPTIRQDVTTYVKECEVCQLQKYEHVAYPGLLQPLPIPQVPLTDIAMDFIEDLPKSDNKTVLFGCLLTG